MDIEAIEAIRRIEMNDRIVARQGQFGLFEEEMFELRKRGVSEGDLDKLRMSKVTMGTPESKQSVYYSEIGDDIGSDHFRDRLGLYSHRGDFIETSKIRDSALFVTNRAKQGMYLDPKTGKTIMTPGGSVQVIVPLGGIEPGHGRLRINDLE